MNNLPIQTYESVVQQRDELEKKLAVMAAENAALNKFIKDDCWVWDDKNETYFDACDGWSEETDNVCWGVILQQAGKVNEHQRTDDDYHIAPYIDTVCDYALLPAPAQESE